MAAPQASAAPRTADGVPNTAPAPAPAAPAAARAPNAPAPAAAAPAAAPPAQADLPAAAAKPPAGAAAPAPPPPAPRAAQSITIPLAGDGVILPAERERLWAEICTLLPPELLESIRRAFRKQMHLVCDRLWAIECRILKTAILRRTVPGDYLPSLLSKAALDLPSCLRDTAEGKALLEQFKTIQVECAHKLTNILDAMLKTARERYLAQARFEALWLAALRAVDETLSGFSTCAAPDANAMEFAEDFFPPSDRRHGSVKRKYAPALIALALLLRVELHEYNARLEHAMHADIAKERKQIEDRNNLDIAAQRDKSASVADISANAAHAAAQEASRPLESRIHKVENDLQSIQGHLAQISAQLGQLVNGDRDRPGPPVNRSAPPAASPRTPTQGPHPRQNTRQGHQRAGQQVATNVDRSPRAASQGARPASPARPAAAPPAAPSAAARPALRNSAGTAPALPVRTTASPVTTRAQRARNGRPLHEPRPSPVYTSSSDDERDAWESPPRRHVRYVSDSDADSDRFTPRRDSRSPPRRRNQPGNAFAALADHDRHVTDDERVHDEGNRADTNAAQRPQSSRQSPRRAWRGGSGRGGSRR